MSDQTEDAEIKPFTGPAGGWGSVRSLAEILPREKVHASVLKELARQNKPRASCA